MGCRRFILFSLNFLVFAAGVAVIVLSSFVIAQTQVYGDLLQDGILTLPIWVLIFGILISLIGFFGCCGALKENQCLLNTYAGIVMALFLGQIVLCVLCFVYQNEAKDTLKGALYNAFSKYNAESDPALTSSIDNMQHDLKCCGVNNYEDWFTIITPPGQDVTFGCCKPDTDIDSCYKNVAADQSNIFTKGCYDAVETRLHSFSIGLGTAAIILALIQLGCIVMACSFSKSIGRRGAYA